MMRIQVAPCYPWRPHEMRMAMDGRLVLKLKPGEDPSQIASFRDIVRGYATASMNVDGGPVDRVVTRFSPRMQVARAYRAAKARGLDESGHRGWDDVEIDLGLSRTFRIEVDPQVNVNDLVSELRGLEQVETASPYYMCQTPFCIGTKELGRPHRPGYAHEIVGSAQALEMEPGDSALIVAVVDSGVSLLHREFVGRLRPSADLVDLPKGLVSRTVELFGDTTGRDNSAQDDVGHGTACAGIIGARGINTSPGVAGAAKVLPIRSLAGARIAGRNQVTALGSVMDIDEGMKMAVDLGARVLNLSFGTPRSCLRKDDMIPHEEMVLYALSRGCVLVAASGNGGSKNKTEYYPAALDGVIAVGAVGPDLRPSSFSTRGVHVDLSAPGERIFTPGLNDSYGIHSGTSFAAPFVAGACALLMARGARRSTPVSAELIRRVLMHSSRPFSPDVDSTGCGMGILDIPAAIRTLDYLIRKASTPQVESPSYETTTVAPRGA